ncbi:hypothetical protein [Microbacterium hydrocarbonoxydans]|uniref:Uncharacterized protein n=1 Tax=Microbacterium hydrocarbonoxydans TaxID=273678 RepID=A0A1H4KR88_9MICO|nr:hypothetical protein [Microbacterium hydrocarbonoxydans]SEB61060.1 hypothetical protein SAMN04489807_1515 [Microbacterium hydrocarbonoxydans]
MPAYEQEHAVRQLLPRTSGDASFAVDALRSKAGVPDVVTELQFDDAVLTREVRML